MDTTLRLGIVLKFRRHMLLAFTWWKCSVYICKRFMISRERAGEERVKSLKVEATWMFVSKLNCDNFTSIISKSDVQIYKRIHNVPNVTYKFIIKSRRTGMCRLSERVTQRLNGT